MSGGVLSIKGRSRGRTRYTVTLPTALQDVFEQTLGTGLGKWFQVHNVLEYFFWFTSRMAFHAEEGFVPLGGNTVFIKRDLLEAAGGRRLAALADRGLRARGKAVHRVRREGGNRLQPRADHQGRGAAVHLQ